MPVTMKTLEDRLQIIFKWATMEKKGSPSEEALFQVQCPSSQGWCHCHWASLKRALPLQVFIYIDKIPLSLLFSELDSPSPLSLSLLERCSSPFIILVDFSLDCLQYVHVSLVLGSPELVWPHQCWGEGSPPSTCWQCFDLLMPYHGYFCKHLLACL